MFIRNVYTLTFLFIYIRAYFLHQTLNILGPREKKPWTLIPGGSSSYDIILLGI